MNLNEFYTISYKNYGEVNNDFDSLLTLINKHTQISIRIYDNKKLLYRINIFSGKINIVKSGNGDYVEFNLINIKKELLQNSLKLLDSDDLLNHILFLEILKLKLNEIAQM